MEKHLEELDTNFVEILLCEDNSSKYAIDAHNRGFSRIGDLSKFKHIRSLDVSFNRLQKLTNLDTIPELREFKAYNNHLTLTSGLHCNTKLEVLVLSSNLIKEISEDISSLRYLKILRLDGNHIRNISNLKNLKNLVNLDLSRNRLTGKCSVGLSTLVHLESLNLSDNDFDEIGTMPRLNKLEEIVVSGNKLTSLGNLQNLPNLRIFRADRNKISNINCSSELKSLFELYLCDNQVLDVSNLPKQFPKLENFDLRNNRLRGLNDIEGLSLLENLEELWLSGNPCSLSETYHLDICMKLSRIQFLDDFSKKDILESPEKVLKQLRQHANSNRPCTPLSRPGTAASRPATGDGRPLIYQPSNRSGSQVRMLSPEEINKTRNSIRSSMELLRSQINNLNVNHSGDGIEECDFRKEKKCTMNVQPIDGVNIKIEDCKDTNGMEHEKQYYRNCSKTVPETELKNTTRDIGTDPLVSLSLNMPIKSVSVQSTNTDDDDIINFSRNIATESSNVVSSSIEEQMKTELLQNISETLIDLNPIKKYSPRFEEGKTAELRKPPENVKCYQGFRIPKKVKEYIQTMAG